eukprot:1624304-Pyramimonas_sp.AAC.1
MHIASSAQTGSTRADGARTREGRWLPLRGSSKASSGGLRRRESGARRVRIRALEMLWSRLCAQQAESLRRSWPRGCRWGPAEV